jgi:hypothetical protein
MACTMKESRGANNEQPPPSRSNFDALYNSQMYLKVLER